MVPWSIALLTMFYAALASASAAALWQATQGTSLARSLGWSGFWCILSAVLAVGLALLKPWARRLAIWSSVFMMVGALGVAGMAIAQANPEPVRSLIATAWASVQVVVIRYLSRPHVKAWFIHGVQLRNQ
jgi:hypothetical protein